MPLRPFFFTKPSDPVAEPVDWFLTPLYSIGPLLPPIGDIGSTIFLLVAALINATLCSLAAHHILRKFSNQPKS
jgi:hypothetical protein